MAIDPLVESLDALHLVAGNVPAMQTLDSPSSIVVSRKRGTWRGLVINPDAVVDVATTLKIYVNGSQPSGNPTFTLPISSAANEGYLLTPSATIDVAAGARLHVQSGGEGSVATVGHMTFIVR